MAKRKPRKQIAENNGILLENSLTEFFAKGDTDTIKRVAFEQEKIAKLVSAVDIIGLADHFADRLDIYNIYCLKTGRIVARRSEDDIQLAMEVHGFDNLVELWQQIPCHGVSAAWTHTGDKEREKLFQYDPLGYLVWAAGICFRTNAEGYSISKGCFTSYHYERMFLMQKAALYETMQQLAARDYDQVIRVAKAFHNYMGLLGDIKVSSKAIKSYIVHLGQLANVEVLEKLPFVLKRAAWLELERQGYGKSIVDNQVVLQKVRSDSQSNLFTRTMRGNALTELDVLDQMLSDIGIGDEIHIPAKDSFSAKVQVYEAKTGKKYREKKFVGRKHTSSLADFITRPIGSANQ